VKDEKMLLKVRKVLREYVSKIIKDRLKYKAKELLNSDMDSIKLKKLELNHRELGISIRQLGVGPRAIKGMIKDSLNDLYIQNEAEKLPTKRNILRSSK
jgi:hypothetical protein